ncbi:MAG TPA: hypothetical protein VKY57_06165 [Chitinispirillaceae bacterium]|nr:hypothetical protein [Chitinispirillaceae bacterium]
MKYNLVITRIQNERTKKILARQLAQNPVISIQKANEIVEAIPFTLYKNINTEELKTNINHLNSLEVSFNVVKVSDSSEKKPDKIQKQVLPEQTKPEKPENETTDPQDKKNSRIDKKIKKLSQHSSVILDQVNNRENKATSLVIGIIVVIFILIILSILGNRPKFKITKKRVLPQRTVEQNSHSEKQGVNTDKSSQNYKPVKREKVSHEQLQKSRSFVDSAMTYSNDINNAIKFYKIAISFNRYNVNAWYGLVDAYKSSGMLEEMVSAKEEMQHIFGKNIFSVSDIIGQFGELEDAQMTENGVYRIEYMTREKQKDKIFSEIYTILKALHSKDGYQQISLFAKKGPGRGMVIHINKNTSTVTLSKFRETASLTYLD